MSEKRHPREVHVELEDRLRAEGRDDLADVLKKCRVPLKLVCLCCDEEYVVDQGCRKRWCPVCGPKETTKRYEKIEPIAKRMQWPLAVMLSIKNPKHIAGCVRILKKAFKGFRKTKFWKDLVRGGFVGFEVTHNGNGAHVHLHALIDCRWLAVAMKEPGRRATPSEWAYACKMAQDELAAVWAAYLGQEEAIVYVRRADKKALKETIKYPIKPSELLKLKCKASDVIDELTAGRNVASFGNCHARSGLFLGREEKPEREHLCKNCQVDRSIVPAKVIDGWNRGWAAPTKRQGDLYFRDGSKIATVRNGRLAPLEGERLNKAHNASRTGHRTASALAAV